MKDLEDFWRTSKWLHQAKLLIERLEKYPSNTSIGLILRHSKRYEPSFSDENQNMDLTEEGKQIARLFGTKLPHSREIVIFYSEVDRCRETAEQIHRGFMERNGKSVIKGECKILRGIGLNPNVFMEELKKYSLLDVIVRWSAGLYPEEHWPTIKSYCKRAANIIWPYLQKLEQNTLAIFVTHDLHSIVLRYGWFGFPLDSRGIDYLGGYAFSIGKNEITVLDYGDIKKAEIPYYWKK